MTYEKREENKRAEKYSSVVKLLWHVGGSAEYIAVYMPFPNKIRS